MVVYSEPGFWDVFEVVLPWAVGLVVVMMVLSFIKSATRAGRGVEGGEHYGVIYVVRQQHCGAIERFGKFRKVVGPGLHVRVPIIDRVRDISLMTNDEHMAFDAKTSDNVTIRLEVSIQYHVDTADAKDVYSSGVYRSLYTLADPVSQMKDYFADALRSQIPLRTLDAVFEEKDEIAASIGDTVSTKMHGYGYIIVTTLITSIILPDDVRASMNRIIASKNDLVSATNEAEADKVRTVKAAEARAESMRVEGEGIANQRKAIAEGLAASIETIQTAGLTSAEANSILMFTQNVGMMEKFAENGKSATVVLPTDMAGGELFGQLLALKETE